MGAELIAVVIWCSVNKHEENLFLEKSHISTHCVTEMCSKVSMSFPFFSRQRSMCPQVTRVKTGTVLIL